MEYSGKHKDRKQDAQGYVPGYNLLVQHEEAANQQAERTDLAHGTARLPNQHVKAVGKFAQQACITGGNGILHDAERSCGGLYVNWGAYPEGMSFAILIMNVFTPLINTYCKPKRFGEVKK